MNIFDTSGLIIQQPELIISLILGSNGIILVSDLIEKNSIQIIEKHFNIIKEIKHKPTEVIVVRSKSDIKNNPNVKQNEEIIKNFCFENNFHYFELSSKVNEGIEEAFIYISTQAYHNIIKESKENK